MLVVGHHTETVLCVLLQAVQRVRLTVYVNVLRGKNGGRDVSLSCVTTATYQGLQLSHLTFSDIKHISTFLLNWKLMCSLTIKNIKTR